MVLNYQNQKKRRRFSKRILSVASALAVFLQNIVDDENSGEDTKKKGKSLLYLLVLLFSFR
jgi:hypothetical protein